MKGSGFGVVDGEGGFGFQAGVKGGRMMGWVVRPWSRWAGILDVVVVG